MPLLPTPNEIPVAGTNGDGLNFVLLMTTQSHGKDQVDGYIPALDAFYKPLA